MLQNLANYLLGGGAGTSTTGGVDDGDNNGRQVALRTTERDDGWTVVDRDSEGNSEMSSDEDDEDMDVAGLKRVVLTRTNSADSVRGTGGMEESWFVTPPPCFTSAGPVHMQTSPLENLLIEHPSMSVYQHTGNRRPPFHYPRSTTPSEPVAADLDENLEIEETVEEEGPVVVVRRLPRHCNRLQTLQIHETQLVKSRRAQKVQIQKASQSTARGFLDRANKAREANGRNWRPRRKERCQGSVRSYANNNRKC